MPHDQEKLRAHIAAERAKYRSTELERVADSIIALATSASGLYDIHEFHQRVLRLADSTVSFLVFKALIEEQIIAGQIEFNGRKKIVRIHQIDNRPNR